MKLNNIHLSLLLFFSLVLTFNFQSCTESNSSDSTAVSTSIDETGETMNEESSASPKADKKHSEMSTQEYADFVAKHSDHLSFINNKMVEIKNEHVKKRDYFQFECGTGKASLERYYNDNDEIHFLSYTQDRDSTSSSAKHHFFWEGKLIYQFYHHVVEEGDKYVIDDHKTYFKDGKMLKCLERKYSYSKNGAEPGDAPYELVDLDPDSKLTKDMEKLLTLSEEEVKTYLCSK